LLLWNWEPDIRCHRIDLDPKSIVGVHESPSAIGTFSFSRKLND
jgi:hypothetical protein